MTIQGVHESCKAVVGLIPDAHSAGTIISPAAIDTKGFDEALIVINAGVFSATGDATITVTECDTSGGSYAAITGAAFTVITVANDQTIYVGRLQCKNWERYIKLSMVLADDVADLSACVILTKYDGLAPVSQVNDVEFNV